MHSGSCSFGMVDHCHMNWASRQLSSPFVEATRLCWSVLMSQFCHADTWAWGDVSPCALQCWGRGCWTDETSIKHVVRYIIVHLRFLNSISLKIQVLAIFHFSWGMLRSAIWVTNLAIISWSSKLGRIQPVVLQDPLKDPEFWRNQNPNLLVCCWPIQQTLTVIMMRGFEVYL